MLPSSPMTGGPTNDVRRLDSLTAVRFWAALCAVLYHFAGPVFPVGLGEGMNLGVDFFYVLSGFILMYNYGEKATNRRSFYQQFLGARIARIYPAFLLAFVLTAPEVIRFTLSRHGPAEAWGKIAIAALATLTNTHAWFPRLAAFWNFPSWSVSNEMFFYLCFPALAVVLMRFGAKTNLVLAVACIGLAPRVLTIAVGAGGYQAANTGGVDRIPIMRLFQFVMGMAIGRVFLFRQHLPRLSRVWAVLPAAVACIPVLFLPWLPPILRILAPTPIFATLIYVLARSERSSASERMGLGVLLGEASYSVYILQVPIYSFCGFAVETMTPLKLLFYIGLLVGASVVTLKLVEQPLRPRIRRLLASKPVYVEQPVLVRGEAAAS